MSTIPTAVASVITSIPKLDDSNWFAWAKKMKMAFLAAGLDGISSGSPPTDPALKARWDNLDRQMLAYVYLAISDEFQYLVEDHSSASSAWTDLKDHFEKSTFSARMKARKELYEVEHDTSRPLAHYLHSVSVAKQKLEALGCTIGDTEIKDVLLMRLDSSFDPVRLTILSQKDEPTLADVKKILTSSSGADVIVKTEDVLVVGERSRSNKARLTDEKGFKWCDTDRDGVCHRCGRSGHIAARCMYNMPQYVKDYIMSNRAPSPSSSSSSSSTSRGEAAGFTYQLPNNHYPGAHEDTGPLLL